MTNRYRGGVGSLVVEIRRRENKMKKKSILLTCIVAIMALAMFVGCDNAPTIPSFVVSGNITQTGDFLLGQNFDPSKFSVTVTYDNGRIVAADDTVSVVLADGEDAKIGFDTEVEAYLGKNYRGEDVTAKATARAYAIKSLAVTGPESYAAVANLSIPASDLTVTATYLDSTNAEKTMVLVPGEYKVGEVVDDDIAKLNKVDTSVETSVTVEAQVGNISADPVTAPFAFTATYVAAPEAPEYALAKVDGIRYTGKLLNLVYDEIPTPAPEDVVVAYTDESGATVSIWNSKVTAADLEGDVVLEFVDANGNPLAYKNLLKTAVSGLSVRMTYEDEVYTDTQNTNVSGTTVKIETTPKEGFALQSSEAIGTANADDFFFDLKTAGAGEYIERLASDEVEVAYVDGSQKAIAADTVLADDSSVFLSVKYKGVVSYSAALTVNKAGEKYVESIEFSLVEDYEGPAKQIYSAGSAYVVAISDDDIESVTINYNYGTPSVITESFGSYGATFAFTTDMEGTKLVADKNGAIDLASVDQLYVEATYSNGETTVKAYEPVVMPEAEITKVVLTGTPAYTYNDQPMYNAEIDWTISLENNLGPVVADYTGAYDVYIAGKPADKLPEYVTKATVNDIRVVVAEFGESNSVSIGSGVSYVDPASIKVELNYQPLLDSIVKAGLGDYKVSFDVVEGTADDTITAAIDSVKPVISNAVVLETGNAVKVTVKYFSEEGTYKTTDPITVAFDGVAYVDFENLAVTPVEGKIGNGKVQNGQIYNVSDFVIDENSYTAHGDVKLEVASVVFGGVTYMPGQTITIVSTETGALTVNVKPFINGNGVEVKGAAVELQVAASLN